MTDEREVERRLDRPLEEYGGFEVGERTVETDPDAWGVPGGRDPGESHAEPERREVKEETDVKCSITGVWRAVRKEVVLATTPTGGSGCSRSGSRRARRT